MKNFSSTLLYASAGVCVLFGLQANNAQAGNDFFDVNGTTAGTGVTSGASYSWEDPNWATASGGTTATGAWTPGSFAEFTTALPYTVTLSADESVAGFFATVSGETLNLNATGSGTLDLPTSTTVVAGVGTVQGFLGHSSSTVNINAPISGSGGVEPENGGSINLLGNNTYTGGTLLASSSTLVGFNNNNSFSTGAIGIQLTSGSFAPLLSSGGAAITLGNNFVNLASGGGVNFASAANTPVISTGTWSLGANNLNLRNNGPGTAQLTLSGSISGSANLTLSGANGDKIKLSGANTYSGVTTIGSASATAITLVLGAANTIASSSGIVLTGPTATLNLGGFSHSMGATTLTLSSGGIIDFGAGATTTSFANSSSLTWTGTLDLINYNSAVDTLQFGVDTTGLTSAQLAEIEVNGTGLGAATINSAGDIVFTPEPSAASVGLLGAALAGALSLIRRRRTS
ncbi:MAG TPA: hypothetical protein VH413_14055 [Verrucomicrobiae bacterium]|jgi:hypothetical protein|nr:hypothetical protein [Verrucomicrobiae bacterium]